MSHSEEVIGVGAITYASGKVAQYDLGLLVQQINFGEKAPYLYRLVLQVAVPILNSTGGSVTIGKAKLYDFLKQCQLVTPEYQFISLLNQAGQSLWIDGYLRKGKLPEVFSDTVITNGSTNTFNVTLFIDNYDLRGLSSPEDELIWLEILRDSKLLLQWGSCDVGQTFGANVSVTAAGAFTVTAELVARDEIRLPLLWKMDEWVPTALKQSIPINGVIYSDIAICASHNAGQADYKFALADFTQFNDVNFDGTSVLKNTKPGLVVAQWNEQAFASGDRLPQYEAATCGVIPLFHLKRSSGKRSKLPMLRGNPGYNIAGSIALANFTFYLRYFAPQGVSYAMKVLQRTGVWKKLGPNPLEKLRAKTASKVPTTVPSKAMVMPIVVQGRPKDLMEASGV